MYLKILLPRPVWNAARPGRTAVISGVEAAERIRHFSKNKNQRSLIDCEGGIVARHAAHRVSHNNRKERAVFGQGGVSVGIGGRHSVGVAVAEFPIRVRELFEARVTTQSGERLDYGEFIADCRPVPLRLASEVAAATSA